MRLLKRHPDEDEAALDRDEVVEGQSRDEPDRVVERRPVDDRTEELPRTTGRDRWGRRTETVPMTVPRRSLRQTMTVPSRRVGQTTTTPGLNPVSVLSVIAGAALAVVGIVTLIRTGVNETWFQPNTEVLDANHTPLLGAIEVGVGVLFLILGLLGSRLLIATAAIAGALAATAAAVEPQELSRELAIESWWAWVLAGVGVLLTLVALWAPHPRHRDTVIDVR